MKYFLITITCLCSIQTFAQIPESKPLTLEECKNTAINNNNSIKNSNLSIESAKAGKEEAKSNYLPNISAVGVGIYGIKSFVDAYPPLLKNDLNNFYFGGVTAIQPIYMGGKINTANELANLQLEVNKVKASQSKDSVLLVTEEKYWNIVNLQEQHKTLVSNEILLNAILKQQKDLLASGLIARNDLLKVKVKQSQLLLDKSKLENGIKIAIFDLCLYTGIDYDSTIVMADTLGKTKEPNHYFVDPEQAVVHNDNYYLLQQNVLAQKLQTKLTTSEYKPTVSVGVSAGQMGSIHNSSLNSFVPTAFGTLNVPISNWLWGSTKHKIKQNKINEEIAANNLNDGVRQLKVGILKNWYDLKDAYKQIEFANENLAQSIENLKVNQDNYNSGLASITELLDAQAAFQQASGDKVTAYANYQEKIANYLFLVNQHN